MSDEAEDEGGLPPVKADNEAWRDLCRWESEIAIGYQYQYTGGHQKKQQQTEAGSAGTRMQAPAPYARRLSGARRSTGVSSQGPKASSRSGACGRPKMHPAALPDSLLIPHLRTLRQAVSAFLLL